MTKSSLDSNFYIDKITRVGVESTFHINDTNTPHLPFSSHPHISEQMSPGGDSRSRDLAGWSVKPAYHASAAQAEKSGDPGVSGKLDNAP